MKSKPYQVSSLISQDIRAVDGACDWLIANLDTVKMKPKRLDFGTVAPRYNEPCYNEDPVITNNIWKPGRITVKYGETNPAITNPAIMKSPL